MTNNKPNDVRVVPVELLEKISQTCMFTLSGSDYEQLRAILAQPADQQGKPIQLSEDVREYLQEGIENATGCEDSDVDYDFANELAMLLGPIYRHAQPADQQGDMVRSVKRYERDVVSGHCDVEIGLPEHNIVHHDHGPNLAEAVARLAYRIAKFHKLHAPTLASHAQPATAKVVLPERMIVPDADCPERVNAQGWNACLDEVEKLNGGR